MTLSQTADTLTVESRVSGIWRDPWINKLDGSENKNVLKRVKPPIIEDVQVSFTTWNGDSLVTRTPVRDAPAPFVITSAMRLEGKILDTGNTDE